MLYRSILAPLAVLMWTATAIIHGAHATEHPSATVKLHHHHHHHHHNNACKRKFHKACTGINHVQHAIGNHRNLIITDDGNLPYGPMSNVIDTAKAYQGLDERYDNTVLSQLFDSELNLQINPRRTAWCAAFVNAILVKTGHSYSGSIQSTSFLNYGKAVTKPAKGDIVVLRGVSRRSRIHVGFLVGTAVVNGQLFYGVLGGNQSNKVQVSYFPANKVIAVRREG